MWTLDNVEHINTCSVQVVMHIAQRSPKEAAEISFSRERDGKLKIKFPDFENLSLVFPGHSRSPLIHGKQDYLNLICSFILDQ